MSLHSALALLLAAFASAQTRIGRYEVFEASLEGAARQRAYVEVEGQALLKGPGGKVWRIPLFWDGGTTWRFRISPDAIGRWSWLTVSDEARLNGRQGSFLCVESSRAGGLRASQRWPEHFQRQAGRPFWFLGDTAWGYFVDVAEATHDRTQVEDYVRTRAAQGFNLIHAMLLSEQGDGNRGGPPFTDLRGEQINPGYWQEVDRRLAFANAQGLTVGLALAWGDKRKTEPFAWRRFPGLAARRRYARYVAARYSAYDVYFLVSGEWHAEARTREDVTEQDIFREFLELGGVVAAADPHGRMIGIHPMTSHGSVREYRVAPWMSFGDYQQNYENLHARVLLSRRLGGPVVNAEYGYFLRDQDGDGKPDKPNSYSAEDMRFASWDIVMAGGYFVTGFGSTYFAGHRHPGPFEVRAPKNREWEQQAGLIRKFFERLEWWKLAPADELLSSDSLRSSDRRTEPPGGRGREIRPPSRTYWALAAPGETYVVYVRGLTGAVTLELASRPRQFQVRQYDPRTGAFRELGTVPVKGAHTYTPPDQQDWVLLLEARD